METRLEPVGGSAVHALAGALLADGPDPELAEQLMMFGRFVGSWALTVTDYPEQGEPTVNRGEWHFGWILGGRGVQDVWIVPPRGGGEPAGRIECGTAVRVYQPAAGTWRVSWSGPRKGVFVQLEARQVGSEIVQVGSRDGVPTRWTFSDIAPDAFRWRNETSPDGGASWRLVQRMECARVTPAR